jgi:4-hydroxy-4-methyl-2-oxoglutarate aldolase
VTIVCHPAPDSGLTEAQIARWRAVPPAVAVDLGPPVLQPDPAIRPLLPPGAQPALFGRAVTALVGPPDFGAVLAAVDRIAPGEVLVIAAGGHAETAMLGEILGGALRRRGAAGVVCDGAVRDVGRLAGWSDLPVFARHVTPRGPASFHGGAVNAPVTLGGALVRPGDLILGDADGLAVVPAEAVTTAIDRAEAKLALEAEWQARLGAGTPLAEVFGLPVGP